MFLKKKNLLILWIAFIIMANLTFVMFLVIKSPVLGGACAAMSAALLIFAAVWTIKRSNEIKKQSAVSKEIAKDKMAELDALLARK